MNEPGNQELAPEELTKLLGGELPSTLPLEGWRTMTLHCQVDAIGPSDRHPNLVKLEIALPPVKDPSKASRCRRCRGRGTVPDHAQRGAYLGQSQLVPCPDCRPDAGPLCTATALHALTGPTQCVEQAGHYDVERWPDRATTSDDPGGWHRAAADGDGSRLVWNDMADGATPHGAAVASAVDASRRAGGAT